MQADAKYGEVGIQGFWGWPCGGVYKFDQHQAVVLEGVGAAELVRKMVGSTEPRSALPGTIRGDYSHLSYEYANNVSKTSIPNVIHASGDAKEAKLEIAHWFAETELFEDYETVHQKHTQPKRKKKK